MTRHGYTNALELIVHLQAMQLLKQTETAHRGHSTASSAAAETAAETDPTDVEMTSEPAMMAGAGDDSLKPQENEASSDAAESQTSKEYVAEVTYERRIP